MIDYSILSHFSPLLTYNLKSDCKIFKYTVWWFDVFVVKDSPTKLISTSFTSHIYVFFVLFFFFLVELCSMLLADFNTMLPNIVTILYIRSSDLIHLNEVCILSPFLCFICSKTWEPPFNNLFFCSYDFCFLDST